MCYSTSGCGVSVGSARHVGCSSYCGQLIEVVILLGALALAEGGWTSAIEPDVGCGMDTVLSTQ